MRACVCVCVVCVPATAFAGFPTTHRSWQRTPDPSAGQGLSIAPLEPPPPFSFSTHCYSVPQRTPFPPSLPLRPPPPSLLAGRRRIAPVNTNHLKTISCRPFNFFFNFLFCPSPIRSLRSVFATRYCERAISASSLRHSVSIVNHHSVPFLPPSSRKLSSMLDRPLATTRFPPATSLNHEQTCLRHMASLT